YLYAYPFWFMIGLAVLLGSFLALPRYRSPARGDARSPVNPHLIADRRGLRSRAARRSHHRVRAQAAPARIARDAGAVGAAVALVRHRERGAAVRGEAAVDSAL